MADPNSLLFLINAINLLIKNSKWLQQEGTVSVKPGTIDGFEKAAWYVKKAINADKPVTIGFFGAQKRGKSTIINQLLGCELLPVGHKPMTAAVMEIHKDSSLPDNNFSIEVVMGDGSVEHLEDITFDDTKEYLKDLGTHKNDESSKDVYKIVIKANFSSSKVLDNNGILLDTPGAEMAFDDGNEDNSALHNNISDVEKALQILKETQINIFLERADYMGNQINVDFYKDRMKPLRPINVVNFMDTLDINKAKEEGYKSPTEYVKRKFINNYGGIGCNPICISGKLWKDGKNANNQTLQEQSNFLEIEKRIIEELSLFTSEKGLEKSLTELEVHLRNADNLGKKLFVKSQQQFKQFIINMSKDYSSKILVSAKKIYNTYCSNGDKA